MSNNNPSDYLWDFHFTLTEECSFPQIEAPPDIRLEPGKDHKDGTKSVGAFIVGVKSATEEEAHDAADRRAKKLVDVLALFYGKYLGYTFIGYEMHSTDRPTTVISTLKSNYDIENSPKPADLSQGIFPRLINTLELDSKEQSLVSKLAYYNKGLAACKNVEFEVAIKEFYRVIEEAVKDPQFDKRIKCKFLKYKFLRNALSHAGPLENKTKQRLCDNFPKDYSDFTTRGEFDHSSSNNRCNVQKEAIELKKIVFDYIREQFQTLHRLS